MLTPLSFLLTTATNPSLASCFYRKYIPIQNQIALQQPLQLDFKLSTIPCHLQDSDIQKKIDHEIRMRDGACKLLAACSQKDQALEAAKSLQTCSTRIMAYMSELQRMKEAQVMQKVTRRSSDAGPMDDRLPCKGKVAISGK